MLLRNYYNTLAYVHTGGEFYNNTTFGDGSLSIKGFSGNILTANQAYIERTSYLYNLFPMMYSGELAGRIWLGTSDKEVTFDDYTLENPTNASCLSNAYEGIKYDANTKTYSNKLTLVLKNSTSSDITVKEIGISGTYRSYLIYREVLDAPITIPAGSSVTYTHEFKFTMPQ